MKWGYPHWDKSKGPLNDKHLIYICIMFMIPLLNIYFLISFILDALKDRKTYYEKIK